jgi:hypothetical protein
VNTSWVTMRMNRPEGVSAGRSTPSPPESTGVTTGLTDAGAKSDRILGDERNDEHQRNDQGERAHAMIPGETGAGGAPGPGSA